MSYACIIPSKSDSNLLACLKALRKHEPTCPIVIVDDGLSDQAIGQLPFFEPIFIIKGISPFVFARNINMGIDFASDLRHQPNETKKYAWTDGAVDGFVLLNDDALLDSPNGFGLMASASERNPEYGVIGAVTNLTGQPLQQPRGIGLREVEHIAFVCCYIPLRAMDKLRAFDDRAGLITHGLLDERYCCGYGSEDADFCMQVRHVGMKVAVLDSCYVDHSKLHSSYRGAPETAGDIWPNHRLLREKWGMPMNPQDPMYRGGR